MATHVIVQGRLKGGGLCTSVNKVGPPSAWNASYLVNHRRVLDALHVIRERVINHEADSIKLAFNDNGLWPF